MKKVINCILPLLLICSLLLLASCFAPVPDTTEFIVQGRIMVPDSSAKDVTGWIPLPNATVTITDSEGITHTVTTDSEGYYAFPELSPGSNYVITATGQIGEDTIIIKDILPLVEEGEDYDAGIADCESTALAMAVEALLNEGLSMEEIDLMEIQNTAHFASLTTQVCLVLEAYGDVTTDPDTNDQLEEVVEEIIPPPSPSPSPPAASTDATLSNLVLSEGTLNPAFASATVSYTGQVENDTTSITVTPTANDSNATIKINDAAVASGSPSGAISLAVGENTITIVVTAEDGTTTKTYTIIVTRLGSSAKEIEEFWFDEDDDPAFDDYIDGDINSTLHTVSLVVPSGTDVTGLTAYFELSDGASATVGGTPQVSGVTANDFASLVTYTVTAEDSTTQEWMVTVDIKSSTSIEEYEFTKADNPALSFDVEGTIDYDNHTVSLSVPYDTRESLIAAFELATGASAKIGTVPQESGVTANNFISPITYIVTAQDGTTTQNWIVTVDEETVRYVANGGSDSNNGSEGFPWLTIQYALDNAPDLCTIIVKDDGPYNETINPPSKSDTDGGRVIILKSATGSTVINGDSGSPTVGMQGCPEGTRMEGFTITHATGVSGKGMYIRDESCVSIINCTISGNETTGGGCDAGIWIDYDNNDVILSDCTISNNISSGSAGGIFNDDSLTLNNCTISGNQANGGTGGGIQNRGTMIINGGSITGNSASTSGGGVYQALSGASMIMKGCTVSDNEAGNNYSAGICLDGGSSVIGGSGTDKNTICSNYITGNPPTLDDQIGTGTSSLDGTYSSTNDIYVNCACDFDSLSALSLSTGILAPTFDCDTINYTATVANNITSITVTPTANYSGAAITVEGESVTSGSASDDIDLVVGVNTITTAVTAQSETTTYTVTVTRELAVGDSYGGGIVAYILQSGDPGYDAGEQHGLIAATADYGGDRPWSNITDTEIGSTGIVIGTGQANTTAIIEQTGHTTSAAYICDFYSVTVNSVLYDDWFLPSKDELAKLYDNKSEIGGFADDWYWSSSEYNYYCSRRQNFGDGSQDYQLKGDTYKVRPVRAF